MLSADEGGGQRCITSMVRNQNKKVTLACSQCCMQNTQTQSRLGPFEARGPQRNKTGSNRSVFHLLCTAFISLTRSSTSGITRTQTPCKNVPLVLLQNGSRAQPMQTALAVQRGHVVDKLPKLLSEANILLWLFSAGHLYLRRFSSLGVVQVSHCFNLKVAGFILG